MTTSAMSPGGASSARDAYDRHVRDLMSADIDAVVAGYAPDAVVVHPGGGGRGHEYIRAMFTGMDATLDGLDPIVEVVEVEDVVLATWRSPTRGSTGADTFVIRDGLIVVHTGTGV